MAVQARHVSASLRLLGSDGATVQSYHRVKPNIIASEVSNVLQAVNAIRATTGGNAFLTITTQLVED